MRDVALDPYTTHGQDGTHRRDGLHPQRRNDRSPVEQVMAQVRLAPTSSPLRHDGRGASASSATAFEKEGFIHAHHGLLPPSTSSYYGPFRDAVGSAGNPGAPTRRFTSRTREHQRSPLGSGFGPAEGADMVMVKGVLYRRPLARQAGIKALTFAYHVSGEYAMIKFAAPPARSTKRRSRTKRWSPSSAGADGILTYCAFGRRPLDP